MTLGTSVGKAVGTVVDDQVKLIRDTWKIKVMGFLLSIVLAVAIAFLKRSTCGDIGECTDAAGKPKPNPSKKCQKIEGCVFTSAAIGMVVFFVGMTITVVYATAHAIEAGDGRALVEQGAANFLLSHHH